MIPLWENWLSLAPKNRLKTQVTGNCATQGVLQHSFQGASLTGRVQLCHDLESFLTLHTRNCTKTHCDTSLQNSHVLYLNEW